MTFEERFSDSCPKTGFVFNLIDTYAKFIEKKKLHLICELKSRNGCPCSGNMRLRMNEVLGISHTLTKFEKT